MIKLYSFHQASNKHQGRDSIFFRETTFLESNAGGPPTGGSHRAGFVVSKKKKNKTKKSKLFRANGKYPKNEEFAPDDDLVERIAEPGSEV